MRQIVTLYLSFVLDPAAYKQSASGSSCVVLGVAAACVAALLRAAVLLLDGVAAAALLLLAAAATPTPATHSISTVLKAGETVYQAWLDFS